jgi:hypothetical protein
MRNLRSILAVTALVVGMAIPIAAWAQDEQRDSRGTIVSSVTVHQENAAEWIFPALNNSQCRAIPTKYGSITPDSSDQVAQTTTTQYANGSRQIDVFDMITGTAVGSGSVSGTYIWVYENHAIYEVPAGDGPVKPRVRVLDSFRMIGNGLNFETGFDWRWRFPVPSGSAFDPGLEFQGVAFPDHAVHPSNVQNFKAFSTRGDPLACDPL